MTQIPDAAVQVALEGFNKTRRFFSSDKAKMKDALTAALPHLPLGFEVKKLVAEERRNKMWDCGRGYMIGWNNEDYYRVRFHGNVILKKIKGLDKAIEWVNKHHSQLILSAIDIPAAPTNESYNPVDVAAVRRQAFEDAARLVETSAYRSTTEGRSIVPCQFAKHDHHHATIATAIRALSAEPAQRDQWQPTHRHVKRGTEYQFIGTGKMQAEKWYEYPCERPVNSIDMQEVAIYRGDDGKLWARPVAEFNDGRFKPLPTAPTLKGQQHEK